MFNIKQISVLFFTLLLAGIGGSVLAEDNADVMGTAKVDMHKYPEINRVYDVNYDDPKKLNALVGFIKNVNNIVPGKAVVVLHGTEIRAFAKENYEKYQSVIDNLAALSKEGV